MLNEGAYGNARGAATGCDCPFEKAILSTCCGCSLAHKHNIAERESVSCHSVPAHEICHTLHDLLKEKSLFALKLTHNQQKLPHAKEIKIQCGGLLGLDLMVYDLKLELPAVRDVHGLVDGAIAKFGALEALPFSEIIKSISTYESRHRRT